MSDVALDNIPDELKILPQWVCWRKAERDGKTTKLPVNPHTGELASTTNSDTWATCTEACNAILRYGCDGIGFVFTADDPYAGVDLDKCRDAETGVLEPWAQEIVDSIQTFTEVSTSGTGVHCILRGKIPGARCRKRRTEMYDHERYFVVTGNCLTDFPLTIEKRQSELEALYAKVFQAESDREGVLASKPRPEITHSLTDDEIIEKACNASDGDKFRRLWEGDDSGYESSSEADAALCALLAFWTGHDPERIDHLFRQSGLFRDKWERDDYREDTIAFAIQGVDNYYDLDHYRASLSDERDAERAEQLREKLRQLQAGWTPPSQDETEPITADVSSDIENENPSSAEPAHTRPTINLEYFESLAQEPGHKAPCLPPHFGTMSALQRFICNHWHRGFVVATKTIEQAKRIASDLVALSFRMKTCQPIGGSLRDHILVLHHKMDKALLQEYDSTPKGMLNRYPIIVTTHERVLVEPPSFFLNMTTPTAPERKTKREFALILGRPDVASITLSAEGSALLAVVTNSAENIEQATRSVQAKLDADNPREQLAAFTLLKQLARVDTQAEDLSPLALARAGYRLERVLASQNSRTLLQDQVGCTVYAHVGLLKNSHVWMIDGTADLTLRESSSWTVVKEPPYDYHLVCPHPPVIPDISMIGRNLERLSGGKGIRETDNIVKEWISAVFEFFDSLAHQHTKILVVMWKDFKGKLSLKASETEPLVEGDTLSAVQNGLLRYFALTMKERHPEKFEFTTYQPNEYTMPATIAEYLDAVVFIGSFSLPNHEIKKLNDVYHAHSDAQRYTLAELLKQTFRSRCQGGQPVALYFTPDWKRAFIQRFLDYTNATDVAGNSLTVFTREERLSQKLKEMGFTKPQIRHISTIVEAYPEFEDIWKIELPSQEVTALLGKSHSRDLRTMLANWQSKGIHITLL